MPRKPRFFVGGIPTHVVQRGTNRQAVFFAPGFLGAPRFPGFLQTTWHPG